MLSFVQNFFASKSNPIGVDFGSDSLRMAQVQMTNSGEYKLSAAASADVPSHIRRDPAARLAFFIETTRDLLAQGNFSGRQAILALPAASMHIHHVRMPKLSEAEIKKALPWEARGLLPFDPSHALIRHLVAGEVYHDQEPKNEIILMAAAREFINQLLAGAAKARLDVIGMNVEPKAIVDCFASIYRRKTDGEQVNCFVDIGCGATRAIITQGRQVFFARSIAIGGDHFNQVTAGALNITFEDAKMLRMQLCHLPTGLESPAAKSAVEESAAPEDNFALLSAGLRQAASPSANAIEADGTGATTAVAEPTESDLQPATPQLSVQARQVEQACREPANRLVDELNLCRRYYETTFPNRPVDRLIFIGGEARHRSLCAHIARELGLGAQVGDPLVRMGRISDVGIESGIDRRQPQPNWAVPIGLSIGPGGPAQPQTQNG